MALNTEQIESDNLANYDGDGDYANKYPTGHTYRRNHSTNKISRQQEHQCRKERRSAIKTALVSRQTEPTVISRQIKQTQLELCPIPSNAQLHRIRVAPGRFQLAVISVVSNKTLTDYVISNAAALWHYLVRRQEVQPQLIQSPYTKMAGFIVAEPVVLRGQSLAGYFTRPIRQFVDTWELNVTPSLPDMIAALQQELLYQEQDYQALPEDGTIIFISKNIYGPACVIGLYRRGKIWPRTIAVALLRDYLVNDYPVDLMAKLAACDDLVAAVPYDMVYRGLSQTGPGCQLTYQRAGLTTHWLDHNWYESGCADRAGALVSLNRVLKSD